MVFRTANGKTWLLDECFTVIEISDFNDLYSSLPYERGEVVVIEAEGHVEMCNLTTLFSFDFDGHPSMAHLVALVQIYPDLKQSILEAMRRPAASV